MPTPRDSLSTCTVNGKIYAIGGATFDPEVKTLILSTVEKYDPETDSWERVADIPTPRWSLCTNVVNGRIYAMGGDRSIGATTSTLEEFTPEGWQPKVVSPQGKLPTTWGETKSY